MPRALCHVVCLVSLLVVGACQDGERWNVVEQRLFEGTPVEGNAIECAGLPCGNGDILTIPRFDSTEAGSSYLNVGAWGVYDGTAVHVRFEGDASYALVRVVSYGHFEEADEHPVHGWVMLEQWSDRAVAVGRFALAIDDERWIRGTFDTRSDD